MARYRVEAAYHDLDGLGLPAGSEVYSGEMTRRIVDADPPVREKVVWRGFRRRTRGADGAVGPDVPLEWADGVAYEHRFSYDTWSDGIEALLEASTGIRRDLEGWNVFLLMIDAHIEFDMPRSAAWRIGALNVPGDETELIELDMPRSAAWRIGALNVPGDETELTIAEAIVLDFEPFIRADFAAGESSRSRFVAVTDADGHESAVLESDFSHRHPFTMRPGGTASLSASTSLRREIQIRLSDGLLERGRSVEWVCVDGRWVNPVYTTELLGENNE
jgi:hypothetical protein